MTVFAVMPSTFVPSLNTNLDGTKEFADPIRRDSAAELRRMGCQFDDHEIDFVVIEAVKFALGHRFHFEITHTLHAHRVRRAQAELDAALADHRRIMKTANAALRRRRRAQKALDAAKVAP